MLVNGISNKGFTLVELLATVSIMAILMIIAIPNVLNTIDRNKKSTYIEDARKLVILARNEFVSSNYEEGNKQPYKKDDGTKVCTGFSFEYLVNNGEIGKGPEGGDYSVRSEDFADINNPNVNGYGPISFVVISYDPSTMSYKYGVQLVEEYTKNGITYQKGIKYVSNADSLFEENAVNKYIYTDKDLNDGDPVFRSSLSAQNGVEGYDCDIVHIAESIERK